MRPLWEGHRHTRTIRKFLWLPKIIDGRCAWLRYVTLHQRTRVKNMGLVGYLSWEDWKLEW